MVFMYQKQSFKVKNLAQHMQDQEKYSKEISFGKIIRLLFDAI